MFSKIEIVGISVALQVNYCEGVKMTQWIGIYLSQSYTMKCLSQNIQKTEVRQKAGSCGSCKGNQHQHKQLPSHNVIFVLSTFFAIILVDFLYKIKTETSFSVVFGGKLSLFAFRSSFLVLKVEVLAAHRYVHTTYLKRDVIGLANELFGYNLTEIVKTFI